jgi:hypothetical protein
VTGALLCSPARPDVSQPTSNASPAFGNAAKGLLVTQSADMMDVQQSVIEENS